jgi:hypothetical protein
MQRLVIVRRAGTLTTRTPYVMSTQVFQLPDHHVSQTTTACRLVSVRDRIELGRFDGVDC